MKENIVYERYRRGQDFKRQMQPKDQYSMVDECIAFYNGDQWRGSQTGDYNPKPVLNMEKLIINRKIAEIRPYEATLRYRVDSLPKNHPALPYISAVQDALNGIVAAKWNVLSMNTFALESCLQAAIQGTAIAHTFWDAQFETFSSDAAETIEGDFRTELLPATNLYLGNPNSADIQSQPYIIVAMRKPVSAIVALAESYGKKGLGIRPDNDVETQPGDNKRTRMSQEEDENALATLLYQFDREDGKVRMSICTRDCTIAKDKKLRLGRYPIAVYLWGKQDSVGYGLPECYDIHKNQIAINRAIGYSIKNLMLNGSPKLLYDNTRINGFSNIIGGTQPVNGDVSGAARFIEPPRVGSEATTLIEYIIRKTLESKGMSDVLLGTQRADNARALAIAQAQATLPLKLEQERFYQYMKDIALNWLDYIRNYYDVERIVRIPNSKGEDRMVDVRGDLFRDMPISVAVDIGQGGEWSEIAMSESILEMIKGGQLDTLSGFDLLPSRYFSNKEAVMGILRRKAEQELGSQQGIAPQEAQAKPAAPSAASAAQLAEIRARAQKSMEKGEGEEKNTDLPELRTLLKKAKAQEEKAAKKEEKIAGKTEKKETAKKAKK